MESQMCSPEITELVEAMIQVQQTLSPALKDAENTFTNSRYATLHSVMNACRDALLQHGIWLTQYPVSVELNQLGLVTKIVHAETGQWQASLLTMPLPKNDPQGYGSAMTYARRYGLSALIGIVTENDDDGEMASQQREPQNGVFQSRNCGNNSPAAQPLSMAKGNAPGAVNLPRLDGVQYRKGTANDGKQCVLATGDTHPKKEFLRKAGFRWDGTRKVWWRYADAA
ncbi:single-stranded DNA-binding protein [Pseudodesulfovibrio nedwellii]|uniref:Single-stranded DNA-binding protein n=1 Tax=Pseudodesulfovibrio nedwellii TaxID=2973072 RepID=A0ABN6S0W7_9BACT|nr:ERF family protein [Pseudodesulfovibrio nedwellii]BDQ36836.1 single-stranded DNA-binding protein [Pseudodesulfovibrio nedwellii]